MGTFLVTYRHPSGRKWSSLLPLDRAVEKAAMTGGTLSRPSRARLAVLRDLQDAYHGSQG